MSIKRKQRKIEIKNSMKILSFAVPVKHQRNIVFYFQVTLAIVSISEISL